MGLRNRLSSATRHWMRARALCATRVAAGRKTAAATVAVSAVARLPDRMLSSLTARYGILTFALYCAGSGSGVGNIHVSCSAIAVTAHLAWRPSSVISLVLVVRHSSLRHFRVARHRQLVPGRARCPSHAGTRPHTPAILVIARLALYLW